MTSNDGTGREDKEQGGGDQRRDEKKAHKQSEVVEGDRKGTDRSIKRGETVRQQNRWIERFL